MINPYEENITKINWFHDSRVGHLSVPYQFFHKIPLKFPRPNCFLESSPNEILNILSGCGIKIPNDVLIDEKLDIFKDPEITIINSAHHAISISEALSLYPIFTVYEAIDIETFSHIKNRSIKINSEHIPFHNEFGPARVTEKCFFYFINGKPLGISEIANNRIKKL